MKPSSRCRFLWAAQGGGWVYSLHEWFPHGAVHLLSRQRGSESHVRGVGRVQRSEAKHFSIVFPCCPCICRFVFEGSLPSPSEHRPPGSKTESWHRIKPAVFFVSCLQEPSHCLPYLQVNIFALTAFDCWVSAALQQLSANYPAGCTSGEAPAVRVDPGFAVPALFVSVKLHPEDIGRLDGVVFVHSYLNPYCRS